MQLSFFNCLNPKEVKLIKRLQLCLSHLRDHNFKHSFQDCHSTICSWTFEVEWIAHYLLHRLNYLHERKTLSNNIKFALPNILEQSDSFINSVLFFGVTSLDDSPNTIMLNTTINYITSTERFDLFLYIYMHYKNSKTFTPGKTKSYLYI